MAQFARPSADTDNTGAWVDEAAGSVTIYDGIDETSPSDVDYIESPANPSSAAYTTALTTIEDPVSSTGHTVRIRYAKNAAGGGQINLTVQLRQGYVSEASQGTQIAQWTYTDISNTLTTAVETLSAGEADAITNYGSLFLRFVATQV